MFDDSVAPGTIPLKISFENKYLNHYQTDPLGLHQVLDVIISYKNAFYKMKRMAAYSHYILGLFEAGWLRQ
jgi:hypothetical protein